MRDFSKISPAIWSCKRYNALTDDAKLTMLYIMTNSHMPSAGSYRLPDAYAAADLRWPVTRYVKARDELVKAGLIEHDDENAVVMVKGWFRFNAPQNASHLKGIRRQLEALGSQSLWAAATAELEAVVGAAGEKPAPDKAPASAPGGSWAGWKPRTA